MNSEYLKDVLCSRCSLIWIVTREEARVESIVVEAAANADYDTAFWDCATGLTGADGTVINGRATDSIDMLKQIRQDAVRRVYVMRDLHKWLDPITLRELCTSARMLQTTARREARAIVVISPSGDVPLELQGQAMVIEWPLPTRKEMSELCKDVIRRIPKDKGIKRPTKSKRYAVVDACMGLTSSQASAVMAQSIVVRRMFDVPYMMKEKKRLISQEKALLWYEPDPRGMDAVRGLDRLKEWLNRREPGMTQAGRESGLPAPRGILLVGCPGCGKSLTAKAVAAAWGLPLIRLDLSALRSKWVGESEGNIRRVLKTVETMAPVVLWVDEIEKALAGSGGSGDGGVAADALGVILTWMQEHEAPVFVVATANNVKVLPAELLRKGRFDEMFYVDLPTATERIEILKCALEEHDVGYEKMKLEKVVDVSAGFSGAEIASLVPEAMYSAFADDHRSVKTKDLILAAKTVVPMSATSREKIDDMMSFCRGRMQPATTPDKATDESEMDIL